MASISKRGNGLWLWRSASWRASRLVVRRRRPAAWKRWRGGRDRTTGRMDLSRGSRDTCARRQLTWQLKRVKKTSRRRFSFGIIPKGGAPGGGGSAPLGSFNVRARAADHGGDQTGALRSSGLRFSALLCSACLLCVLSLVRCGVDARLALHRDWCRSNSDKPG